MRFASSADVRPAAVAVSAAGEGVVLLPTETFYGLGARPGSPIAIERLLALKGRPARLALPVLCAGWGQVEELVRVPVRWRGRLRTLWPGPVTAVLPCRLRLPAAPDGTLGVRIPAHDLLRELLARVGPLTGTSANRHGAPACADVPAALASLEGAPDLVLDGGPTPGGLASTVVDLCAPRAVVVRPGPVRWQ